MAKRVIAKAQVKLLIELPVQGSWGPDCAFEQVNKQAAAVAVGMIRKGLTEDQYRLLGAPDVTVILLAEES